VHAGASAVAVGGGGAGGHGGDDHGDDQGDDEHPDDLSPEHHRDPHDMPHESGALILVPIVILAIFSLTAGFLNATPLGEDFEQIKNYVEPSAEPVETVEVQATGPGEMVAELSAAPDDEGSSAEGEAHGAEEHNTGCGFETPAPGTVCFFPTLTHAEPTFPKILLSLGVVAGGYALAIAVCVAFYGRRNKRLVGLTDRSRPMRAGYLFLKNKYYLDDLYEKVIVHAVAHPIARAANWVNQNVLDGIVNGVGRGGRKSGELVYRYIDQDVVDGAVNASGVVASETGHGLQPMQSGKVNQYGALLFGAAAVGAIVLVIINVN